MSAWLVPLPSPDQSSMEHVFRDENPFQLCLLCGKAYDATRMKTIGGVGADVLPRMGAMGWTLCSDAGLTVFEVMQS